MPKKDYKMKNKKEQFATKKHSKLPYLIALAIMLIGGAWGGSLLFGSNSNDASDLPFGEPVTASRNYIGRTVSMTPVEPVVEAGQVMIPLELLETHELVSFTLENSDGFQVPLMAYITPSGRIFAGSSMCEPCQGRSFFLAGETLVCESCRTTYTIESHEFLSGSQDCGRYPPVYMTTVIVDGIVNINLEDILNWRIRTY